MKKVIMLLSIFISCKEPKYEYIGQEIIDGKVSAIKEGTTGRFAQYPRIWVQNPTSTREVKIPFEYEGRWKVGDSCLLIGWVYMQYPTPNFKF